MAEKKEGKKKNKTVSNIILIVLLIIMVVCGFNIGKILYNYRKDSNSYDKVKQLAQKEEFDGNIDFDALRAINSDIIGWLYLKDTNIDYPVVKAPDNNKYLYTLFDGSTGGAGTLFTDCYTNDPFNQFSTIVYGHHMKDKSMFYTLDYFGDREYAEEHDHFELITPGGKYHLKVWAFVNMASDSKLYTINVPEEEGQAYIDMIQSKAHYTIGDVSPEDKLVLLSTCAYEYENARHVVVCKMEPWE